MAKEELRSEWAARVEAFNASGQTQVAFCTEHGLYIKQFGYWLRKYRAANQKEEKKTSQWLALEVRNHEADSQNNTLEVRMGKAVIEVGQGFDRKLLLDIVKTLDAIC